MSISTNDLQPSSPSVPVTATPSWMQLATSITQSSNYRLTVDLDELLSPKRSRKRKSKGRGCTNPPRPKNAFILFLTDFEARVRRESPMARIQDVAAWAGRAWRNASDEVHQLFNSLEAVAKELHRTAYPDYSYRAMRSSRKPRSRGGSRDESAAMASKARTEHLIGVPAGIAAEVLGTTVSASTTCGGEETVAINTTEQRTLEGGEYVTSSLPITYATHSPGGYDHMLPINLHDYYNCYYYYHCPCPHSNHVSSTVSAFTNPSECVDFLHAFDSHLLPSGGGEGASDSCDAAPTNEVWFPDEQCHYFC